MTVEPTDAVCVISRRADRESGTYGYSGIRPEGQIRARRRSFGLPAVHLSARPAKSRKRRTSRRAVGIHGAFLLRNEHSAPARGGGAAPAIEWARSGGQSRFLTSAITELVFMSCRVIDASMISKPPSNHSARSQLIDPNGLLKRPGNVLTRCRDRSISRLSTDRSESWGRFLRSKGTELFSAAALRAQSREKSYKTRLDGRGARKLAKPLNLEETL